MNNIGKATVIIFLVLVALIWFQPFRLPIIPAHPHQAIPNHTALFFSIEKRQLHQYFSSDPPPALAELFMPKTLEEDLDLFDDILGDQLELQNDETFYVTINPTSNLGNDLLFILPYKQSFNLKKNLAQSTEWRSRTFLFHHLELFTLQKGEQEYSFSKYRNLLIFARHAYLVENAISQLKKPAKTICHQASFRKILKNAAPKENDISLYLNLEYFSAQFSPLIEANKLGQLKNLSNAASWIQFYLPIEKASITWEGLFKPNKDNAILTSSQRASSRSPMQVFQSLPNNLSTFIYLTINSLNPSPQNITWQEYIAPWIGDELVIATGEPLDNGQNEQFILVRTKDTRLAEERLLALSQEADQPQQYDYQMFKVFQLDEVPMAQLVGLEMATSYASVLGDYVLFSSSRTGMDRWLGKYLAGQTYANDISLLKMKASLPEESHGFLFMDGNKGWQQLSLFLSEKYINSINRNPLPFEKIAASITWTNGLGKITFVKPESELLEKLPANILWSVPLSGQATGPPNVFTNPQNGEKDVFITDDANHIYLISRSGRVLWKKQLSEPIMSDITHIDFHNNREGQFAFSTRSAIYVVDRQGEYIDGFPLHLQVPATNGVTVVDFFQSNDYNFFVACENGNAYGFDEKGSPIEGWRPNEGIGHVEHPLQHFQANGKDFLVLLDVLGEMQVFKKNGSPRFKSLEFDTPLLQKPGYQVTRTSSRIVTSDAEGTVFVTNLLGDHFKLRLKVGKNEDVKFLFTDVFGDERKDYVSLSGKELAVYYYKGKSFKKAFSHSYPTSQDDLFPVILDEKKMVFIGTVNKQKKQISILDGKGNIPNQFPLAGTTPFVVADVAGDGELVVITGNGERVTAYSLE